MLQWFSGDEGDTPEMLPTSYLLGALRTLGKVGSSISSALACMIVFCQEFEHFF